VRYGNKCLSRCGINYVNSSGVCVQLECSLRQPLSNNSCSLVEDFSSQPYSECFYVKSYGFSDEFVELCTSQCPNDNFEMVDI
jgi:hypothetical protein